MKSFREHLQESSAGLTFGRMPISGMLDRAFVEKMPWQGQMHPEFWNNETQTLWGAMAADMKAMVNQFIIKTGIPRDQIADIIFKGSLTSYNYIPTSDIDLQVILKYDWNENPLRDPKDKTGAMLEREFNNKRAEYNRQHGYTLGKQKYPVEFFIQTPKTNVPTGSSSRWSLMKNKWLPGYKPDATKPTTPPKKIAQKFQDYYKRIKDIYLGKLALRNYEAALTAKKALGAISGSERNLALHGTEDAPVSHRADVESPENLAFKALKRTKMIAFIETEVQKGKDKGLDVKKKQFDDIGKAPRPPVNESTGIVSFKQWLTEEAIPMDRYMKKGAPVDPRASVHVIKKKSNRA